jgi:LmbE family N-acetylglucosaminyl deacetylase
MTPVRLDRLKKVLCLGAHSDDIEIGCGGTLLRLIQENPDLQVYWYVFNATGVRVREARQSARDYLKGTRAPKIRIGRFQESYFPSHWPAIKDAFEEVKRQFEPDLVLTHFREDRHQDHRVLSDLAWNTFRNHLVLEYEIPKYDGDLGAPNIFFPFSRQIGERKVAALMRHFKSQSSRQWFTADTFWALMRLRGIECASPGGFAEAFHGRKFVL